MPRPWPDGPPGAADRARYANAEPAPYWIAAAPRREPTPPLSGPAETDLCIVGGGFTGLWAALHAKADDPGRDVLLVEAGRIGGEASGRNGGFVDSSLTHGIDNGLARFADEIEALERLGAENFAGLRADIERHGIECAWEEGGGIGVALEPHELEALAEEVPVLRRFGHEVELLDGAAMRAEVDSPTYLGGLWDRTGQALVDPARLAAGLLAAALRAGVRVHEHSPARELRDRGWQRRGGMRRRDGRRSPRPPRDQRLPAPGAADPPLRRADLRLRAGHRAAHRADARGGRVAPAPGHRRHG